MPRPKVPYRLMQLRLPPDLHQALKEFTAATNAPATSFVVSVLVDALPVIKTLTAAAIKAKAGQVSALADMRDLMVEKSAQCSQLALDLTTAAKGDTE